jgi:putative membrane protein
VFARGEEPDPRFSMANERTFLAWIRTGLALLAGGVALETLASTVLPGFRLAASALLIITGASTPLQAWFGWKLTELALRLGRPLPPAFLARILALVLAITGCLILLGVVLR